MLRCVNRSVTTPNSKETKLQGKVTSEELRAEFQQNNLSAKGGLGLTKKQLKKQMNLSTKFMVLVVP